jgi:RNA polymerase sigma factor (sigma-70 family)
MIDDAELLRRYSEERSEAAFAEFVHRHIGWVYHAGLRRTGGRHDLAQEVAQYVFTAVAREAAKLSRRESLGGWLYTTARFAASRVRRTEMRRLNYETAVHAMTESDRTTHDAAWEEVRPALDEMIDRLPTADRETLFLRFFEGRGFREIGGALNLSEDGARKRVDRALDKLRALLARRGVTSSASALGTLLAARVNAAVALEIQAGVTAAALSGAAVPGAAALGLIQFMSATKATLGGAGLIATVLCLSTLGVAVYQTNAANAAEAARASAARDYEDAQARLAALERENPVTPPTVLPAVATPAPVSASSTPARPANAAAVAAADPRADGKAFLDAFGGELRQQYRETSRRQAHRRYALFFAAVQLSPEKQQALIDRTVQQWEETLEVTPTSMQPAATDLSRADLRSILGAEDFKQWQEIVIRGEAATQWAMAVAQAVNVGSEPLALDKIAALQRLVRENSAEFREGKKVNERTVDWAAVLRQARPLLTDSQWRDAQPHLLMREAMHALEGLSDTENQDTSAKKP